MDAQVKRKVMAKGDLGRPKAQVTLSRPVSPLKSSPAVSSSVAASPAASPRPRAAISGSAKSNLMRKPNLQQATSKPTRSGALTPRSLSPSKQLEAVRATTSHGRLSPALPSVTRLRSKTSSYLGSGSLPSSPRLPNIPTASGSTAPILPATASDPLLLTSTPIRIRHASISSMSDVLASTPQNHLLSPPSSSLSTTHDADTPASSPMRIKAKVTSMAKAKPSAPSTPATPSFTASSPPQQQLQQHQLPSPTPSTTSPNLPGLRRIGRTSSVSSLSTFDPIYPITVSHPAGNPHRFASQRGSSPFRRQPLPFTTPTTSPDKENDHPDPVSIPLPPLSPPSSTLSFSSHSSTSRSSLSSTSHSTAPGFRISLDTPGVLPNLETGWPNRIARARASSIISRDLGHGRSSLDGDAVVVIDEGKEEERKQRAEAKSNRKIADLEITNSSLLAINASLEASKHKQAKEIRELRKKLRETRLVLPPRVYREMRETHGSDNFYADERIDDGEEEDDNSDGDADDEAIFGAEDATYMRVRSLIDDLLESGRRALESKPEDFEPTTKGGKVTRVLHEVEVRTWRAETYDKSADNLLANDDEESSELSSDNDDDTAFYTQGNGSSRSEDEVEELIGNGTKGSI